MVSEVSKDRVMHKILERQAEKYGSRTYIYYKDKEFSFEEVNIQADRVAAGMQKLGIVRGDKVSIMMDTCPEMIFLLFGLAKLGAIVVPINTAHKGELLSYLLDHSDSQMLAIHRHFVDRLESILDNLQEMQYIMMFEGSSGEQNLGNDDDSVRKVEEKVALCGKHLIDWCGLVNNDGGYQSAEMIWSDPLLILYTSGTTGLSKGVLIPHNLLYGVVERYCDWMLDISSEDRIYVSVPLYHAHAWHSGINLALFSGASVVLAEKFSASGFWDEIKRYNCTYSLSVGGIIAILLNAEPKPDDADNPVRVFLGGPTSKEIFEAFQQRFGVRLLEFFGMTEIGAPVMNRMSDYKAGACGKIHPDYSVKIVDDNGVEVGVNTPGEMYVRSLKPYSMMCGYYKMPDKTVEAWSDLWFHTGDYGFLDEEGYFYFYDRKKDYLRRRGENISSFELEKVINSHPAILESAVIGVRSDLGEEEVMVCLVPTQTLSNEEFMDFCQERMAYFMVPRYVRFVAELPKTPSYRVEKYKLREEGITSDTWDRENAGYKLRR